MGEQTPFPSQQDCTKNQFGLWLLYLTPDGPKVSPSHSPFCLYATGPWFDHQTSNMFSFDLLSWPQSKNLHLVIAQTRSGTDPVHLHALYVVCTQLFYNKNVLNSQQWCGLTHHAFFSCSCVLKGTSAVAPSCIFADATHPANIL